MSLPNYRPVVAATVATTTTIAYALQFGEYSCIPCRLYADTTKPIFHCDGCGICRVGKREDFFHCKTCNSCWPVASKASHRCVERALVREGTTLSHTLR